MFSAQAHTWAENSRRHGALRPSSLFEVPQASCPSAAPMLLIRTNAYSKWESRHIFSSLNTVTPKESKPAKVANKCFMDWAWSPLGLPCVLALFRPVIGWTFATT